ncbi:MAG: hypothetical protein MUF74_14855 [Cypionkella sp.]|jgi:hypothetical protein|nr:hypothetical protein [Cypionkella sp.]
MDYDLMFVIGATVCALTIPSVMSAYADGRAPRVAAILFVAGGFLLGTALVQRPGGLTLGEIPDIFFRVLARYI